ncbi:hypothetical protein [Sediminivirga luteola]|uniref:Uncharacterized protein n=1 Tax=Sediminivirga luteola TaxID=1774748 RepID=A0A8J2TX29_9MICO|nr:hypothetical protein [Sediminivirga luteola]GGA10831.1 hypothetical protein GCM10011333_12060 [Sediminivirga luteola]
MTSWDERAEGEAGRRILGGSDFAADMRAGLVEMARWQREALLSDRAVERAAGAIDALLPGESAELEAEGKMREARLNEARAALRAVIGDDDE